MGSCPYCGTEVEVGKFICERCSDSSSNPTVSADAEISLSSVPSSSLSEQIASESVIQIEESTRLSQAQYVNSTNFESSTVESKFKDSRSDLDSVENLKEMAEVDGKKAKQPYQVVSETATESQAVKTSLKVDASKSVEPKVSEPYLSKSVVQKSSLTETSQPVIQKTSLPEISEPVIQKSSLPKSSQPEIQKTSLPDSYQVGLPTSAKRQSIEQSTSGSQANSIKENQSSYTAAQRQYMKETDQNILPQARFDYTSAQREFLSDTKVEERLKDMSPRELGRIEIHRDFNLLNSGSEQNNTLYGVLVAAAVIFVFPIMTTGVVGFTFSVFLLAMIFGLGRAIINSLVNTDWNKYASWVYDNSKPQDQEFQLSFSSAYMVDRLIILDKEEGDNIPMLGKSLKVRKHTRDLTAVQNLYNKYSAGRGFTGKLFMRDEDEPLVCVVEIDKVRFWCEPIG